MIDDNNIPFSFYVEKNIVVVFKPDFPCFERHV